MFDDAQLSRASCDSVVLMADPKGGDQNRLENLWGLGELYLADGEVVVVVVGGELAHVAEDGGRAGVQVGGEAQGEVGGLVKGCS